ncbi:MAG: RimK family alpha-L-glutamate ligase [Candidatus Tectomicrobia bacterium]|uniref:RimK family alpha-L-glutamate ligase n=1 Tax=Tectimicrobiota bacterium TaxID=2528274 RepID=A0A932HVU0_UNCTE|nr:RimK family alpha-L-glutamate ligase [Candidatus Tectomicrobia bacterium]
MARIGVFIERYTVQKSEEMGALLRLGHAAERLGHRLDVLFRSDMYKIPEYDALFIRALTDPLNASFVAARLAEMHGLRVIDDPGSILVCCDKVNMYRRVQAAGVAMPDTVFLDAPDVNLESAAEVLARLGSPAVLKAPNSSFSRFVDKVETPGQFVRVGKRFLRRADRLVAQRFVASEYDWRVGVLAGEPLYVCRYMIPKRRWKVLTYMPSGRAVFGEVRGLPVAQANPLLVDTALRAAAAIGKGLYGVDLKQVGDEYFVIEVNDNPTIAAGEEDQKAPGLYERIVRYLAREWG